MTDEQWIELGRRVVACKHWRWMPGMLARYEGGAWHRVTEADSFGLPTRVRPPNPRQAWPDLRDPATVGCLLALVRKAWDDPFALVDYDRKHWGIFVEARDTVWVCTDKTEAAALVAALKEAAND